VHGSFFDSLIPFYLALLLVVLLVTYVPWLSTGLLDLLKL
jgi:TRAP-type C4-dicarboxylate transport system permease large subunit